MSRTPPAPARRRTTLKRIAQLANTSVNTVSRALNDQDGVADETRALIKKIAADNGYRPDLLARGMRARSNTLLGMLVEDVTNPFFTEMLAGAEREAYEQGMTLLIGSSNDRREAEREHIDAFLSYRCSGMALCLISPNASLIKELDAEGANYIILDAPLNKDLTCDRICLNYLADSITAVRHLASHGHRRIAIVSPKLETDTEKDRFEGYNQVLAEMNEPRDEKLVRFCETRDEAFESTLDLCRSGARFTAIYVTKAALGLAVLSALDHADRRIPSDVSVLMFGHSEWAEVVRPEITRVRRPVFLMGQLGIRHLVQKIGHVGSSQPQEVILQSQLVEGGSVARL